MRRQDRTTHAGARRPGLHGRVVRCLGADPSWHPTSGLVYFIVRTTRFQVCRVIWDDHIGHLEVELLLHRLEVAGEGHRRKVT
jgi:hypothetical protein